MIKVMILNVSNRYSWHTLNRAIPVWKQDAYKRMKFAKDAVVSAFGYFMAYVIAYEQGKNSIIRQGKNGKPEFEGNENFFNVSHSNDKVICAIGGLPIGADIERVSEKFFSIRDGFLSQREKETFQNIAEAEKSEYLCTVWTLKEAYGKWKGIGLNYPVSNVSFIKEENDWKCYLEDANEFESKCEILTFRHEREFIVSICTESCVDISIQYVTEEELFQKGKEMGVC